MQVVIFGATGMIGQGALRECLLAGDVTRVVTVGRTPVGVQHPKLHDIVHRDLFDLTPIESQLDGIDTCIYTLGVTSAGMPEADYSRVTYDLTMSIAETLVRLNPQMTFLFVSGAGTDATEQGRTMWARVKGRAENALQRVPFRAVYSLRPGFIQPVHGARSKTAAYRVFYAILRPVLPLLRILFPSHILTTESLGKAMLAIARNGAPKKVLESRDLAAAAR